MTIHKSKLSPVTKTTNDSLRPDSPQLVIGEAQSPVKFNKAAAAKVMTTTPAIDAANAIQSIALRFME